MKLDLTHKHGILQPVVRITLLCILILPIIFLLTLRNSYTYARSTDPNCPSEPVDPKKTAALDDPTVGGQGSGTSYPRLGAVLGPDGNYHCPAGGGGNATSCDGGNSGSGGLNRRIDPTPTGDPTEYGTIQGYALYTSDITSIKTCDDVNDCLTAGHPGCGGQYLLGTNFYFDGQGPHTQTDSTGVTVDAFAPYTYTTVATNANTLYTPNIYCHKNQADTRYTLGPSIDVTVNETTTVLVGFITPPLPWTQVTGGGDTYANKLYSLMPLQINPNLLFDTTAAPLDSGILSVKTEAVLSDQNYLLGLRNISSKNWNTNNGMASRDWYTFYTARLAQAAQLPYDDGGDKPTWIKDTPYTVYTTINNMNPNLIINSPWTVADGERLIVIVDGNLNIWSPVTLTNDDTGFVAFVVKGNITIHPSVGTTQDSQTPVVEGMYIAGETLKTGTSSDPSSIRFVGKGMFTAKNIRLQRTLGAENKNKAADLFIYNPAFLVTMPDILKDLIYQWQEVAP